MNYVIAALAGAVLSLTAGHAVAATTVLDFDDLPCCSQSRVNTTGYYRGVYFGDDWKLTTSGHGTPYSSPNAIFGTGSPSTVGERTMTLAAPARFDGAYMDGASGASIQYHLYLAGVSVFTSDWIYFPGFGNPLFYASGYSGAVDQVAVYGRPTYWAVDNVTFSDLAAGVPEPGSWGVMIGGGAAIGALLRRRRRAVALAA